jgi:hypothetical protein
MRPSSDISEELELAFFTELEQQETAQAVLLEQPAAPSVVENVQGVFTMESEPELVQQHHGAPCAVVRMRSLASLHQQSYTAFTVVHSPAGTHSVARMGMV